MPASRHLKLETVDFGNTEEVDAFLEQVMSEGIRRVRSESAELQAKGLMDADGNLLTEELPSDPFPLSPQGGNEFPRPSRCGPDSRLRNSCSR